MATTAFREAAFAAIAARLSSQLSGVAIERNRRGAINPEEALPRVILRDGGHSAEEDDAFGRILYRVEAVVEGHATAATDAAQGPAVNDLHARVVAALIGVELTVGVAGGSIWMQERSTEVVMPDADTAATPTPAFVSVFAFDLRVPDQGGPYTTT
jgi:hypothetical protein